MHIYIYLSVHTCGYICIYAHTHVRGKGRQEDGRCRQPRGQKVIRRICNDSGKDAQTYGLGADCHSSFEADHISSNDAKTRIASRHHPKHIAWCKTSSKLVRGFAKPKDPGTGQKRARKLRRRSSRRRSSGKRGQKRISRQVSEILNSTAFIANSCAPWP